MREMQSSVIDSPRPETADRQGSTPSLFGAILRSWKFKALAVGAWLGYWLLYAVSGGMLFFYYPTDIRPFLKTSPVPNPSFINDGSSFFGLYKFGDGLVSRWAPPA
ncbi:MAG: hypothetical protein JRN51_11145 [Nitrososphaerota archaeon]|nr:hypothetical protein [Nitrososphaerota archaeon]